MATLLSNTVWEGLSTEPRPTPAQGAMDGQFFKELDTGESYIRRNGIWEFINLGLSFIKATKSGKITTNGSGSYHVTFTTSFIDANYTVQLNCDDAGGTQPRIALYKNVLINGFDIQTRYTRTGNPVGNAVVAWLATRDYNP